MAKEDVGEEQVTTFPDRKGNIFSSALQKIPGTYSVAIDER